MDREDGGLIRVDRVDGGQMLGRWWMDGGWMKWNGEWVDNE